MKLELTLNNVVCITTKNLPDHKLLKREAKWTYLFSNVFGNTFNIKRIPCENRSHSRHTDQTGS